MILKSLLSVNYIFWLVASAIFFAVGEFFSKKFALNPSIYYVVFILLAYCVGTMFWLPAILQKNQLSIVGTIWSVMSLLATVAIGVLIFNEKLGLTGILGIIFAFISIILLAST
jgi:multidrug transporter EmrE-like cation transporter